MQQFLWLKILTNFHPSQFVAEIVTFHEHLWQMCRWMTFEKNLWPKIQLKNLWPTIQLFDQIFGQKGKDSIDCPLDDVTFLWQIMTDRSQSKWKWIYKVLWLWPFCHNFGKIFLRWTAQSVANVHQKLWRLVTMSILTSKIPTNHFSVINSVANRIFGRKHYFQSQIQSKFAQFPIVKSWIRSIYERHIRWCV